MSEFATALRDLDGPWYDWGPQVIAAATNHDRPLMLICGLDSDHWSAQLIRNLQADREAWTALNDVVQPVAIAVAEHPGVAARVQQVLAMHGAGGWPAVAFALPDGRLVGAIPYAPVRDADKRAGILRVALDMATAWQEQRADLEADAAAMAEVGARFAALEDGRGLPRPQLALDAVEAMLIEHADTLEGGFGGEPRWYYPAWLLFLLTRCQSDTAAPSVRDHFTRTLDAIVAGGVHDHIGGGFFRGAHDRGWKRPFADKRLMDQALLIDLLLRAETICDRPLYRAVALHALEWVRHALRSGAGWCHALHADSVASDGSLVDGAAYAWSKAAVANVIGAEGAAAFAARYLDDQRQAVDDDGDWLIPAAHGEFDPSILERLPEWCRRLAVARNERPQPARCERVVFSDQGLWLRALAAAMQTAAAEEAWRGDGDALAVQLIARIDEPETLLTSDLAAIGRGLQAWSLVATDQVATVTAALTCAQSLRDRAQAGQLAVAVDPIYGPVFDPTDAPDGVAAVAQVGHLWLDLADQDQAWLAAVDALLNEHAGVMRIAPASCVGLCSVWQRRLAFG